MHTFIGKQVAIIEGQFLSHAIPQRQVHAICTSSWYVLPQSLMCAKPQSLMHVILQSIMCVILMFVTPQFIQVHQTQNP